MKKCFAVLACAFLHAQLLGMDITAVAERIITQGWTFLVTAPQTNDITLQNKFYDHIAEQHFGIGVDSYARYAGHPVGGITKMLRSEFVCIQDFHIRSAVEEGARCLWCKEIMDAHIKPHFNRIVSMITPLLRTADQLRRKVTNNEMRQADADACLRLHHQARFSVLGAAADGVQQELLRLQSGIADHEAVMQALLNSANNFATSGDVPINSVATHLTVIFAAIPGHIATCMNIDALNASSTLTLASLQTLNALQQDWQTLNNDLQLLDSQVQHVRNLFKQTAGARTVSQNLFMDVLTNGKYIENDLTKGVTLFYEPNNPAAVDNMLAELPSNSPTSSWYDPVSRQLVDRRVQPSRIRLSFIFNAGNLFYGTMYPER